MNGGRVNVNSVCMFISGFYTYVPVLRVVDRGALLLCLILIAGSSSSWEAVHEAARRNGRKS